MTSCRHTYNKISDDTKDGYVLFLGARGFGVVLAEEVADANQDVYE